jgi:ribosomal protein S18 acetylase RimI-like enzyme
MEMRIRHADDRDWQTIAGLLRETLQDMASAGGHDVNHDEVTWQRYGKRIAEFIPKEDRLYLLAQTGSSVVGLLAGKITKLHEVLAQQKSFHISAIYVSPKSRRLGIGTALVKQALQWALEQGCQEADLNVLFNNDNAQGLYKKIGFKVFRYELRMKLPKMVKLSDDDPECKLLAADFQ